jgi:methylenetetrahydrofolate dehydrogenase (NADP+)/methenyltetrahydrofolate cyclohydrolase
VDGVQVLKPLPPGVRAWELLRGVPADKDVEGVGPENQGLLFMGSPRHVPCTAHAALMLLDHHRIEVAGMHAVVVGRSDTVGRPVAALLIQRDATVVVCHTRTRDLAAEVVRADLVMACAGRPELVRAEWIADGAVVVDIGYHVREDGQVVGDVEAAAVDRAGALSPVRGGVGPLTVTMLMANMIEAARLARGSAH